MATVAVNPNAGNGALVAIEIFNVHDPGTTGAIIFVLRTLQLPSTTLMVRTPFEPEPTNWPNGVTDCKASVEDVIHAPDSGMVAPEKCVDAGTVPLAAVVME